MTAPRLRLVDDSGDVGRAPPSLLDEAGNLAAFLRVHARRHPDRTALVFADGSTQTYGEIDDVGGRMAEVLQRRGVQRGARVLVLVPPGPHLYTVLFALMGIGAVAVIVDPSMSRANLRAALASAQCTAVVSIARGHLLRALPELWRARPFVVGGVPTWARPLCGVRLDREAAALPRGERAFVRVAVDDDALITFTTGSTGTPKGARRSHGVLNAQGAVLDRCWPRVAGDVELATLPVFATMGLAAGITSVFPAIDLRRVDLDAFTARAVRDRMNVDGVTTFGGSPAFVGAIAEAVLRDGVGLRHVRRIAVGGAPVTPQLAERVRRAFVGVDIRVVYGSTECEPIAIASIDDVIASREKWARGHGVFVGVVDDDVRVELLPFAAVGNTDIGEVCVAGPHVLRDYVDDAVTGAQTVVVDGVRFLRTGDIARRDARGLWLLGRVGDVIVSTDGRALLPLSIEAIAAARGVDAALIAVDGRSVLAVVGTPCGTDAVGDLATLVDRVVVVDELPRDPRHRARIDRATLRAQLRSTR